MGYSMLEFPGKLPGFLSPSLGMKWEGKPHGLATSQRFTRSARHRPSHTWRSSPESPYSDFASEVLAPYAPPEKGKKLASELAEGCRAMMATTGRSYRDGGWMSSASSDWALYTASPLRALESEHC